MTYSQYDPAAQNGVSWNFGAKIEPKRPFNQKRIWAIRFFLDREERIRDRAFFDLAIDSKLRGCDLAELSIGDLASGSDIRKRSAISFGFLLYRRYFIFHFTAGISTAITFCVVRAFIGLLPKIVISRSCDGFVQQAAF